MNPKWGWKSSGMSRYAALHLIKFHQQTCRIIQLNLIHLGPNHMGISRLTMLVILKIFVRNRILWLEGTKLSLQLNPLEQRSNLRVLKAQERCKVKRNMAEMAVRSSEYIIHQHTKSLQLRKLIEKVNVQTVIKVFKR